MSERLFLEVPSKFRYGGSWGATQWEEGTLRITAWADRERGRGGFEIFDLETRGERCYGEGGLWFNDEGHLVDYDGVGSLDSRILSWLEELEMGWAE